MLKGKANTFAALGLLVIHAELPVAREESGVVIVGVACVRDLVVFLKELFYGWVRNRRWQIG